MLTLVREWEPPDDVFAPSKEGLGRVISSAISKDPASFVSIAHDFKEDVAPTYVRAFLTAFREACRKNTVFPWEPILDLCAWVTDQPRDRKIPQPKGEEDVDWVPTRKTVADLLTEGFSRRDSSIPFTMRRKAWPILEKLAEDPDPTPEHEKKYGGPNMDPVSLCINSIRGQAMHAVIRYALWVSPNLKEGSKPESLFESFLVQMTEVQELLDQRLDPKMEPSAAVHSIFGQYLPNLLYLDKDWVLKNLSRIFPQEQSLQDRRDAAWGAYIRYCRLYDEVALVLRDEYRKEIKRLGEEKEGDERHIDRSLAEHLMIGYWRGLFDADDKTLIDEFFEEAEVPTRASAIFFVGRNLQQTEKGTVSDETLKRLRNLWLTRLDAARVSQGREAFKGELASFGSWVADSHFDMQFTLERLQETLSLTSGSIRMYNRVAEYLAIAGNDFPLETVTCLDIMMRGNEEMSAMLTNMEEAGKVLETALSSENAEAKKTATDLINYLGAKGFHGFRSLLDA